jgi:HEAT repeat protein
MTDRHAKEDIVRTLSVPCAKPAAAPVLIDEFKAANDPTGEGLRWTIANGIAVVADDAVFEELLFLAQDKQYGKARELLTVALGNMKNPRAVPVLIDLLDDEQVVGYAVMALGKLKAPAARMRLEELMLHATEWVREEARKALAGIEPSGTH